ncbi:MAG: BrnT family toxin [Methylococcales symbiont of Iophon sp. n. MRB-2018]|nr:MAG: BrnT family toxin [Methylococcales symbiont of Iophon sp. n. MRB-2018]
MIKFEWDAVKALKNVEKHGVSFEETSSVFYDEFAVQFYDDGHSELEENHFLIQGISNNSRMLMICHCEKQSGNVLRIISARKATKNERNFYHG